MVPLGAPRSPSPPRRGDPAGEKWSGTGGGASSTKPLGFGVAQLAGGATMPVPRAAHGMAFAASTPLVADGTVMGGVAADNAGGGGHSSKGGGTSSSIGFRAHSTT
jgi:hypothetical protein